MFRKWYGIVGITPELLDMWKHGMREDVIAWEESGRVHALINLTPIEAIVMRCQMRRNNKKQNYYQLQLVSV